MGRLSSVHIYIASRGNFSYLFQAGCVWEAGANQRIWRKPTQRQGEHYLFYPDSNLSSEIEPGDPRALGCNATHYIFISSYCELLCNQNQINRQGI